MGVIISYKEKYFNLGLIKLIGTLSGERIFTYLAKHLQKFHLDIQKDISVIVTCGASNMVKMAEFFTGPQVLCFAHFLNLVVGCSLNDNTIKNTPNTVTNYTSSPIINSSNNNLDSEEDSFPGENHILDVNRTLRPSGNNFDRLEDDNINKESNITNIKNYLESIKKVRGIMEKIKKSPKKMENMLFSLELSCLIR